MHVQTMTPTTTTSTGGNDTIVGTKSKQITTITINTPESQSQNLQTTFPGTTSNDDVCTGTEMAGEDTAEPKEIGMKTGRSEMDESK